VFSAAELTDLRADQEDAMDKTCLVVTHGATVSDSAGGWTPGTDTTVSVACRVGPPSNDERVIAERLGQQVDAVVTLPYDTTLSAANSITVDGVTYQVEGINAAQSFVTAVRALVTVQR
jgi:SPP1 family predicted phage head-tail adaptor